MKYHLAILTPGWIDLILDGSKTIESRFTKVRCAPFGQVHADDSVYLKESGGLVKGMFTVAKVETFENLTEQQIYDIDDEYGKQIFGTRCYEEISDDAFNKWLDSKHATLIHISDPVRFVTPFPFPKRDPRAWVVLDMPLHSCEICKDPFLLEVFEDPDGNQLMHGNLEHFCPSCYAREVAN